MDPRQLRLLKIKDAVARWAVTAGGLLIIVSVLGILVSIAVVAAPLFFAPSAEPGPRQPLPPGQAAEAVLAVGSDEYLGILFLLGRDGGFTFLDAAGGGSPTRLRAKPPGEGAPGVVRAGVVRAEVGRKNRFTLAWSNGWVTLEQVSFPAVYDRQGKRRDGTGLKRLAAFAPAPGGEAPLRAVARLAGEGGAVMAALLPGNRVAIARNLVTENLLGETRSETHRELLADPLPGPVNVLAVNSGGTALYAGTENGYLLRWELGDPGEGALVESRLAFGDRRAITALALLAGETTLVVGDGQGGLSTWFPLPPAGGGAGKRLQRIATLAPHQSAVAAIFPSERSRSLASLSAGGVVHFDHATTGASLLALAPGSPFKVAGVAPRFNGVAGLDGAGNLVLWKTQIPHPEAGAKTYFGKVWYESYRQPEYVWQSSSADDDFEPKLSLVPLIFGTLKGTLYGMVFAAPLAILGALYTSHLMRGELRQVLKPAVEVMGSVPSVVIGFLAALWLAPIIHTSLLATVFIFAGLPLVVVTTFFLWEILEPRLPFRHLGRGQEFLLLGPVVVLAVWGSFALGGALEQAWFGGDLPQWMFRNLGLRMDQRNAIVIAFGLGFAVVPIIFTIADDALVNVPRNLTAASLALGASRWQTVWRVVLPSASPGIFAAVMIGFGRAVGETMIVLMATGNTPIMDWGPHNGMRTLAANIAVEIPEAPVDSTLYRTLFLSAVVLFVVTFFLNSVAEVVRQRLRRRFGNY